MLRAETGEAMGGEAGGVHIADLLHTSPTPGNRRRKRAPPPKQILTSDPTVTTEPVGGVNLPDEGPTTGVARFVGPASHGPCRRPGALACGAGGASAGATRNLAEDPAREGDPTTGSSTACRSCPHGNRPGRDRRRARGRPRSCTRHTVEFRHRPAPQPARARQAPAHSAGARRAGAHPARAPPARTSTTRRPTRLSAPPRFRALGVVALIGLLPGIVAL